jgi:hypothetical protein
MEHLSRRQLVKLAPGARRRWNAKRDHLLCTQGDFLDPIQPAGYEPVFALQGATHEDSSYDPEDGRHLVVAARPDGTCLTLLNSHCKLLRVWVGAGLWDGSDVLMYGALPVQRWVGVENQLSKLDWRQHTLLSAARGLLLRAQRSPEALRAATGAAISGGYLGRGLPARRALLEAASIPAHTDMLTFAFGLVRAARAGNLEPSGLSKERRNIQGIRRPDALQVFSLAAFKAALRACK